MGLSVNAWREVARWLMAAQPDPSSRTSVCCSLWPSHRVGEHVARCLGLALPRPDQEVRVAQLVDWQL